MKKGIFSISEKHERITIRYRRKRKILIAICEDCGKQFEWLTVDEAASLIGQDAEDIRKRLKVLRRENNEYKIPKQ